MGSFDEIDSETGTSGWQMGVTSDDGTVVQVVDKPAGSGTADTSVTTPSDVDSDINTPGGTQSSTENDDGTITYNYSIPDGENFDVTFTLPEDFEGTKILTFYPYEYADSSFIYETFADDSFDEDWSNTEQVDGYSDGTVWSFLDGTSDLLNIAIFSEESLLVSVTAESNNEVYGYHRYLPVPSGVTFENLWIGVSGNAGDWLSVGDGATYILDAFFSLVFFSDNHSDGRCAGFNLRRLLQIAAAGEDTTGDCPCGQTEFISHGGFFDASGAVYVRLTIDTYSMFDCEYTGRAMPAVANRSGEFRDLAWTVDDCSGDNPVLMTDSVDRALLLVEAGDFIFGGLGCEESLPGM